MLPMIAAFNPSRSVDFDQAREQLLHGDTFGTPDLADGCYSPVDRPSAIFVFTRGAVLEK